MRKLVFTLFIFLLASPAAHTAVKWNNPSSTKASNSSGEINTYDGTGYIHESESPNFETLRWSLYRKIYYRPLSAKKFHSIQGINSYAFRTELKKDDYVIKQMKTTPLLSYLLYEDGKITIDEKSPEDRFGDMFSDTTMYHSMSMGKSITSFLVGHAICQGKVESLNTTLDDWPVLKNTLYENQKLINFLNMASGDKKHSKNDESNLSIQTRMATEFKGTRQSALVYNYTNLNTNIVLTYLLFKFGDKEFKNFLDDIFQNKVKIKDEVSLLKISGAGPFEISLSHQFFATRYDYLRIAKSMLVEWHNDTCVGKYLKNIHQRRISKNGAQGTKGRVGLPQGYAGFFHTSYKGMKDRAVMGMDGNGGQTILIDFDRGRIVATLSVFDGMRYPKQGSFDFYKISYKKIKDGKASSKSLNRQFEGQPINKEQLLTNHKVRKEKHQKTKKIWDERYKKILSSK